MSTLINKETLLAAGWQEEQEPIGFLMNKLIENRNPINDDPQDTDIKLVLHSFFNEPMFAVLFPDGGMLNFIANTIEELQDFENRLTFYDCPF